MIRRRMAEQGACNHRGDPIKGGSTSAGHPADPLLSILEATDALEVEGYGELVVGNGRPKWFGGRRLANFVVYVDGARAGTAPLHGSLALKVRPAPSARSSLVLHESYQPRGATRG
jgi:hypothetical protein